MITFLNVPFHMKEEAKRLGARFDMSSKRWFVPDGVDLAPMYQWLNNAPILSAKTKKVLRRRV